MSSALKNSVRRIARRISGYSEPLDDLPEPKILYGADAREAIDFIQDGSPFYRMRAKDVARWQVENMIRNDPALQPPVTILLPEDLSTYESAAKMDLALGGRMMLDPDVKRDGAHYHVPKTYAPILVSFGLGLGFQIEILLGLVEIEHLIICETEPEAMAAGLAAQDWEGILRKAKQRRTRISFIFQREPHACAHAIGNTIRLGSLAGLPGARFFGHHRKGSMPAAIAAFFEMAELLPYGGGYLSDELRQVVQGRKNLSRCLAVAHKAPPLPDYLGAAIVGSGPSLDSSIEVLRKIEGRAYIIAAGTALTPLLRAGIKVDALVEIETHPMGEAPVLSYAPPEVLAKMLLFAPLGIMPGLVDKFRRVILYPRDMSVSTELSGAEAVRHAFARSGNAAAALALHIGFRQIMLFGMDTGYLSGHHDHAAGTVFGSAAVKAMDDSVQKPYAGLRKDTAKDLSLAQKERAFMRVPSITGGFVEIDYLFAFSLSKFNEMIAGYPDAAIHQIGLGARMIGALNTRPDLFVAPAMERRDPIDDLIVLCDISGSYDAGIEAMRSSLVGLLGELKEIFPAIETRPIEIVRAAEAAVRLFDRSPRAAAGLVRGSILTFLRAIVERSLLAEPVNSADVLRIGLEYLWQLIDAAGLSISNALCVEAVAEPPKTW